MFHKLFCQNQQSHSAPLTPSCWNHLSPSLNAHRDSQSILCFERSLGCLCVCLSVSVYICIQVTLSLFLHRPKQNRTIFLLRFSFSVRFSSHILCCYVTVVTLVIRISYISGNVLFLCVQRSQYNL